MGMDFLRKLPIPAEVKEKFPLAASAEARKRENDAAIAAALTGESGKLLLIVGPCSADRRDAVLEYCTRLARLADTVRDKFTVIARVYTNKPRTTGDGYKGMLYQPDPSGRTDTLRGILATRELHAAVLTETGLPTADELLYPAEYRYLSDLLSYVTVGARSSENQEHRLVASGIEVPVGMKNPTGGDVPVMLNSIHAAQQPHTFIYRGWEVTTGGNPLSHAVLRGYTDRDGCLQSNCTFDSLLSVCAAYSAAKLQNPAVIVDTNHANSGKMPERQPEIAADVLASCRRSRDISAVFRGFMIESYLFDGAQSIGADEVPGKSITDACLGWEKTEEMIYMLADRI